jgi:hypothetical protein
MYCTYAIGKTGASGVQTSTAATSGVGGTKSSTDRTTSGGTTTTQTSPGLLYTAKIFYVSNIDVNDFVIPELRFQSEWGTPHNS